MSARLIFELITVVVTLALFINVPWLMYCAYTKLDPVLDVMEKVSGRRLTPIYSGPKGRFLLLCEVQVIATDPRYALKIYRVNEAEAAAIPDGFRRLAKINHRLIGIINTGLVLVAGMSWSG
ncbi:hypothetical protein SFA35_08655 [Pseudomonas sp. HR96]|uniref:hypothetical protein n=1 Tax=Pseudomonas sp. HR96 TaxID=1027966 RepID=UPI002A74D995|nr:hypothetical protein [Pseudomonas sp. HR96]WPP01413.1 hypothetical protein SFA35_08655 [Pseudomonas sp. HR96]